VSIINIFRSAFENNHDAVPVSGTVAIKEALPEVDFENAVIAVNGFYADENYVLQDNDICTIRLFPKKGKGGWNPIDTALTAAAFIANPVLGVMYAAATGLSYAFSNKTLGSLAAESFISNSSDLSGAPNSPESLINVPQLRGAKNQSNKNKPIPLVMGKHLYTPMYIGAPYTEIGGADGEEQYYNVLYLLGWGKLNVSDIRLGPVSGLAKNQCRLTEGSWSWNNNPSFFGADFINPSFKDSNPQLELRQGASEVGLYPQKVVEERLSIELINIKDKDNPSENKKLPVTRFSAKNPQKVQVEITFNQGLISYDEKGNKRNASVGVLVEWRANPNADEWKEFGRFGTDKADINGKSPTDYSQATKTTTITRQKAKVMRFVAEKSFAYDDVKDYGRTIEIRVIRTTAKKTDDTRTADTVYLSAIRTWCFDNEATISNKGVMVPQAPMIAKYRNQTARLGFRIKAADVLQGTIDSLNCIVESYARTWNGSAWSPGETPTNNPASVALKILQSPALGNNAYPDSMLDLDSFGEFYQWCAERKYTCNSVLTAEKRVDDLLNIVLSTGRAMRILNGNRYAVLIDKPRENPVMILNNQNVLEAKNEKLFEDLPDGFSVKFINELDGYQETEIYVMADGSAAPGPLSRMESVEMPFVTDYEQVVKNCRYLLACRRLRPETWIRKLSVDGYLIGIGNRVEVQDDTIVVGIGEGAEIKGVIFSPIPAENGLISEIQTDGQFDVSVVAGKEFGIKIMHFDGVHNGTIRTIKTAVTKPGIYSNFVFNPPIGLPFTPQKGDIIAFGEYNKITTPAICFGKKDNGDGTFDVTLIPYQEGIYNTDSGKIPPYEANITTPQRPVQPTAIPEFAEIINERISDVASRPVEVNRHLFQLILSIPTRILDCDHGGNILDGILPFTSQATLYVGTKEVDIRSEIIQYPGKGSDLFDPMLGSFVPVRSMNDVIFSLKNEPEGVTIDEKGLITISKRAKLSAENYITVVADYFGQIFTAVLFLKLGVYTPRYLGVCVEIIRANTVKIKKGVDIFEIVAWQGDWVSYKGGIIQQGWRPDFCYKWTGAQWEEVPTSESASYMEALADITRDAPSGAFSTIFASELMSLRATIKTLESEIIRLRNPEIPNNYIELNGEKGIIKSSNYDPDAPEGEREGFMIDSDGKADFYDITIREGSVFKGFLQSIGGVFEGELNCDVLEVKKGDIITHQFPAGGGSYPKYKHSAEIEQEIIIYLQGSLPSNPPNMGSSRIYYLKGGTITYKNSNLKIIAIICRNSYETNVYMHHKMYVVYLGVGGIIDITSGGYIQYPLQFTMGNNESKLLLKKLPTQVTTDDPVGTVYKYHNASLGNVALLAVKE